MQSTFVSYSVLTLFFDPNKIKKMNVKINKSPEKSNNMQVSLLIFCNIFCLSSASSPKPIGFYYRRTFLKALFKMYFIFFMFLRHLVTIVVANITQTEGNLGK